MRLHLLTPLWFDNRRDARRYASHRRQRHWRQFAILLWIAIASGIVRLLLN